MTGESVDAGLRPGRSSFNSFGSPERINSHDPATSDSEFGSGVKMISSTSAKESHDIGHENDDAPKDTLNFVYLTHFFVGIGVLLPWNAFITASDYFSAVLIGKHPENAFSVSYLAPNVLGLLMQIQFGGSIPYSVRTLGGLMLQMVGMIVCLAVSILTQTPDKEGSEGSQLMFVLLMSSAALCGLSTAFMESGAFGFAAALPPKFTSGIMTGMGIAGFSVCMLRITTKAGVSSQHFEGLRLGSIIYFGIAVGALVLVAIAFVASQRTSFVKYYHKRAIQLQANESESQSAALLASPAPVTPERTMAATFADLKGPAASVWLVFAITLSIFPSTIVLMKSHSSDPSCWFSVIMITLFNTGDVFGRASAGQLPLPNNWLLPAACLRIVFLPLFVLVAVQPDIVGQASHDWVCYVIMLVFSITNGHIASSAMMAGPLLVPERERRTAGVTTTMFLIAMLNLQVKMTILTRDLSAGNLMVFCLTLGLATGAGLSWLLLLITHGKASPCIPQE